MGDKSADTTRVRHTPSLSPADARLAGDLHAAIQQNQLFLRYQPLLDTRSGRIVGSEALLRWTHPVHGAVSPEVFIPLAERLDLIEGLGRSVLRQAVAQQHDWRQDLGEQAPEFVSVNVSAQQLASPRFVETVREALADADLPACALALEITETAMMTDLDTAAVILRDLADLGVMLEIDDFGTGYSSLAYLTWLPVHAYKLDKAFLRGLDTDPRAAITVAAVLGLGASLGLRCVAEGVETAEHLAWLRAHNCDLVQGFYVSPPIPADDLNSLIASGRRW